MGLSLFCVLGLLVQVLLAHGDESCTECPSCKREGLQTNVLSFVNGDNSPLLVGYDNNLPWQYEVLNGAWANNGNITGTTFSVDDNGPLYIRNERVFEIKECDVLQLTLVAQFELTALQPFPTVPLDAVSQPYYGCAYWQAFDSKTGLNYGFVITNVNVYAIYARQAQTGSTYATFYYLVPIFARQNPQQYNIYQLAFDKSHNSVTYRVDGSDRMVMFISGKPIDPRFAIQLPTSGSEALVFPEQVQMSLGILRLGELLPNNGGPEMILYDYCDCQQSLVDIRQGRSESRPAPPQILAATVSVMKMVVASIGVSRLIKIQPVCKCGEGESSDSDSSCSAPRACKDPSSSSDSTSDPCNAHSSDFSFW